MIEKITNQNQIARHKLAEKINEIIDWINDVCALNVTNKQVTANLPNIDAGELTYLQKGNSDLKDEIDRLLDNNKTLSQQLEIAVEALQEIISGDWLSVSTTTQIAENGLDQINNIDKGENK